MNVSTLNTVSRITYRNCWSSVSGLFDFRFPENIKQVEQISSVILSLAISIQNPTVMEIQTDRRTPDNKWYRTKRTYE